MSNELEIAGTASKPGSRTIQRLPITRDLDGGEISVSVHVVRGARPGPVLGLFGVQHGNEWIGIESIRRIVTELDPEAMSGTLLAVPVSNPVAFGNLQRNTQPESDGPDLNRVWPGTHSWLAEATAKVLAKEIVGRCDALLDFHPGPWGSAFGIVSSAVDFPDPEIVRRSYEMGVAFGYRALKKAKVVGVFPGARSLTGYGGARLGIPTLGVDIGGVGFGADLEQRWVGENLSGVRNVLRHLGILNEPLEKPARMLMFSKTIRVNPTVGGLLAPRRNPDELWREVRKGEPLGEVVSPYTFEILERLISPCDGWLAYIARSYPLRPGDWAFGAVEKSDAEWVTP